jgi:FKBP-type peptidyl-prolyl cis-trans isomerase FklB
MFLSFALVMLRRSCCNTTLFFTELFRLNVIQGVFMKLRFLLQVSTGLLASSCLLAATPAPKTPAMSDQEKLSYTIGVDLARNLQKQNLSLNPTALAKGMSDVFSGQNLALTDVQMRQVLASFQEKMMEKQQQAFKKISTDNMTLSNDFLSKNKTEKGVVVLPSGLQYKVLTAGTGAMPKESDTVTVEYEGKLVNGQVFDSTYERGKPATFKVSQVIEGWQQALKMMTTGSEWMIYIPSKLAYGERGAGDAIGPNEALIFKVRLLSVNTAA